MNKKVRYQKCYLKDIDLHTITFFFVFEINYLKILINLISYMWLIKRLNVKIKEKRIYYWSLFWKSLFNW